MSFKGGPTVQNILWLQLFSHSSIHPSIYPSIHPSIHPLVRSFVRSFVRSLIHSFTPSLITPETIINRFYVISTTLSIPRQCLKCHTQSSEHGMSTVITEIWITKHCWTISKTRSCAKWVSCSVLIAYYPTATKKRNAHFFLFIK